MNVTDIFLLSVLTLPTHFLFLTVSTFFLSYNLQTYSVSQLAWTKERTQAKLSHSHPEALSPSIGIPCASLRRPPSPGCQPMRARLSCRCIVGLGFNLRRVHTKNHFAFTPPPRLNVSMHFSFTSVVILCHHKLA